MATSIKMLRYKVAAVVSTLLAVTSAQVAPFDAQRTCTTTFPDLGIIQVPVFPVNEKVLLDSYNYINLLGPNSVWQTVDNDDNNPVGVQNTSWFQNIIGACRQTVEVCGFAAGPQDNWLITQLINRTVDGVRLPQVRLRIEYEHNGCNNPMCRRIFAVHILESSAVSNIEAQNTALYKEIDTIASNGLVRQTETTEINFATDDSSFYLAIRDETSCIVIHRITVFYNVCPQETAELTVRPEIIAPPISNVPIEVMVECVLNAMPMNRIAPKLNCNQGGRWTTSTNNGCECRPGFFPSQDRISCIGCQPGMYLSSSNGECRDCPANSNTTESGLAACPCFDGYYRAEGEEDLECTLPPGPPRNVEIVDRTDTSIILRWEPPEFVGGRGIEDLMYSLWYQEGSSSPIQNAGIVNRTIGVITGLLPGRSYRVFVTAENGLTDQIPQEQFEMRAALQVVSTTAPPAGSGNLIVRTVTPIMLVFAFIIITIVVINIIIVVCYRTKKQVTDIQSAAVYDTIELSTQAPQLPPPRINVDLEQNIAYPQSGGLVDRSTVENTLSIEQHHRSGDEKVADKSTTDKQSMNLNHNVAYQPSFKIMENRTIGEHSLSLEQSIVREPATNDDLMMKDANKNCNTIDSVGSSSEDNISKDSNYYLSLTL